MDSSLSTRPSSPRTSRVTFLRTRRRSWPTRRCRGERRRSPGPSATRQAPPFFLVGLSSLQADVAATPGSQRPDACSRSRLRGDAAKCQLLRTRDSLRRVASRCPERKSDATLDEDFTNRCETVERGGEASIHGHLRDNFDNLL